jgi:hypothetical protein
MGLGAGCPAATFARKPFCFSEYSGVNTGLDGLRIRAPKSGSHPPSQSGSEARAGPRSIFFADVFWLNATGATTAQIANAAIA